MPISEPPLTDAEKKRIRALISQDEKVDWFWSTLRVWLGWGSAAAVALTVLWDHVKKLRHAFSAFFGAM